MTRLIYKSQRWARKKARSIGRFWTVEDYRGGYRVREMTAKEREQAQFTYNLDAVCREVFAQDIPALMESSSTLYSLMEKR